jgi:AraC-like DNA-binding protein
VRVQPNPIREWREQFARRALNVDFEPLSDAPFRASIAPVFERIVRIRHSPGTTFRDDDLVKEGDDAFGLVILQTRNLEIRHRGRELTLGRGDAALMRACETGFVGSHDEVGYICAMIPSSDVAERSTTLDSAIMQRVPRRSETLNLLRAYLRAIELNPPLTSAEAREIVRGHLIDLVVLAVTSHGAVGESGVSAVVAARLSTALDYISAHFQDPELSVAAVAKSQGISPSYLHRLMEASGNSFTARVNELRLQRVLTLLTEPCGGRRHISDIALEAGFSDLSHFNRLFRSRFGDTPSGVRGQRQSMQ